MGEESRTAKARVVIPNVDGKWRPGLFASVELVREQASVPIMVANEAIQEHGARQVVFVLYDDQYEAQPVQVGRSDGTHTEILKGLSAGDKYVSRKAFILKAELGKSAMSHQH